MAQCVKSCPKAPANPKNHAHTRRSPAIEVDAIWEASDFEKLDQVLIAAEKNFPEISRSLEALLPGHGVDLAIRAFLLSKEEAPTRVAVNRIREFPVESRGRLDALRGMQSKIFAEKIQKLESLLN